ncbi:MAG: hypothetical protein HYX90_06855 [Chloroflexi bacterium]|nr:hypothetical protein [Chloroflexota bacterium]
MRQDIEFKSQGLTCRGWLYTPDEGKPPFPCIITAMGAGYVKDESQRGYIANYSPPGQKLLCNFPEPEHYDIVTCPGCQPEFGKRHNTISLPGPQP